MDTVAQGCCLCWLSAARGAGLWLRDGSRLSRQTQLLPHPSPYPAGGASAGASDCCHMALMCTQHDKSAYTGGDAVPPSYLHPFARSRVGDIRCLHRGWSPTAACPTPDLACWRWGWAPGMARSPPHAGEGALGAGERALLCPLVAPCCLVRPGSTAGCRAAAAVPPWQGKLVVTHCPHQPCLLGNSSRTPSLGSRQLPCPPHGSGHRPRSCRALGGCWRGWLPPVGDVPRPGVGGTPHSVAKAATSPAVGQPSTPCCPAHMPWLGGDPG